MFQSLPFIILDSLVYASWLFLVASGLTLIYGVMKVLNIAHGSLYAFGAYSMAWLVGWFANFSSGAMSGFFQYLSIVEHFEDFSKGIFDTGHLMYYVSICGITLFLAHQSIESLRWRS